MTSPYTTPLSTRTWIGAPDIFIPPGAGAGATAWSTLLRRQEHRAEDMVPGGSATLHLRAGDNDGVRKSKDEHIVYHPQPEGTTCSARGTCVGSKLPSPQLEAAERPVSKWAGIAYTGHSSTGYECSYCTFSTAKPNTIQQHCKKHFPPEHACLGCGDKFHLKTEWKQHHLATCDVCHKTLRVGSMVAHKKTHDKAPSAGLPPSLDVAGKAQEWFDKSTGHDAMSVFSVPNSS